MREIKFRVWCKNKNEWEKDYMSLSQTGQLIDVFKNKPVSHENHIIQMHTGLKDKNGKEIYEGDIFIINKDDDEWYDTVIWDSRLARFELNHFRSPVTDISLLDARKYKNCEIIGNIYENPELLEEQNQ